MSEPQKLSERLRDFLLDYGEASDEETEKMVTDAEALEAKCEHLETVFSELGIAFDDLKRMKEAEVATLREQNAEWERWNRRCIETKNEWGNKLTDAESRLAKAQDLCKLECEKCLKDNPDDPLQEYDCSKCIITKMRAALGVSEEALGVNVKVNYEKGRGPSYGVAEQLVKAGVHVMPEMVFCDKHKPITFSEFVRLPWKEIGCAHQKDVECTCECHKKEAGG